MRGRLALLIAPLLAAADAAPRFGWLEGRWLSETPRGWTEEQWSADRGGDLVGFGRTGRGEAARTFDFMRIGRGGDGGVAYFAQPGGRPAVAFRLVASGPSSAVFENPAHDFPQRIAYRRDGDRLIATISRIDGGSAISWTYRRP